MEKDEFVEFMCWHRGGGMVNRGSSVNKNNGTKYNIDNFVIDIEC